MKVGALYLDIIKIKLKCGENMTGFLIDTSIILDDVDNLIYIYNNMGKEIFISDVVIEELDKHKGSEGQNGYFAREFFRSIDYEEGEAKERSLLQESIITSSIQAMDGDFFKPVFFVREGIKIPLTFIHRASYRSLERAYGMNDTKIAEIAEDYKMRLLSNDSALKIRLLARGIESESLMRENVENPSQIDFWHAFYKHREDGFEVLYEDERFKRLKDWSLLEIIEEDNTGNSRYLSGRKFYGIKRKGIFELLDFDLILKEQEPYILPINLEQKMLYALLTHPSNLITIATGSSGSGKTLIALQAGIYLVKKKLVDGIIYLRNTITANDKEAELGFRKGDETQKLHYFMYPLFSAINFTISVLQANSLAKRIEYRGEVSSVDKEEATEYFLQKHKIEVIDIAHARGVTLSNKFVIFDEVQNASNATLKLIGTRMGEGSRICFLGDYRQIDHPYLSKFRNGAVSLLQKALNCDELAGIQLRQVIRSDIARFFEDNF